MPPTIACGGATPPTIACGRGPCPRLFDLSAGLPSPPAPRKRILAGALHQPRPDGVHQEVLDDAPEALIRSQGMIVKARSPECPALPQQRIDPPG